MKKLTLLIAVAAFATSCNSKASGNHGVVELQHETAPAEEMHHKGHAAETHEEPTEETKVETTDSTKVAEAPKAEVKDTVKADH